MRWTLSKEKKTYGHNLNPRDSLPSGNIQLRQLSVVGGTQFLSYWFLQYRYYVSLLDLLLQPDNGGFVVSCYGKLSLIAEGHDSCHMSHAACPSENHKKLVSITILIPFPTKGYISLLVGEPIVQNKSNNSSLEKDILWLTVTLKIITIFTLTFRLASIFLIYKIYL